MIKSSELIFESGAITVIKLLLRRTLVRLIHYSALCKMFSHSSKFKTVTKNLIK
jgi:hypothetical protein